MLRWIITFLLLAPFGLHAGETALSHDGKWQALANAKPYHLIIQSLADQSIVATFEMIGRDGTRSAIEGVYTDLKRRHFLVTLRDSPEYWLISTDPNAPPVYEGFVHSRDARMIEGLPSSEGLFSRRRILLDQPIQQLVFDADWREMTALTGDGQDLLTFNLNVNRQIATQSYSGEARH